MPRKVFGGEAQAEEEEEEEDSEEMSEVDDEELANMLEVGSSPSAYPSFATKGAFIQYAHWLNVRK